MTLMYLGFGLMTVAAETAVINNRKFRKRNKVLCEALETTSSALGVCSLSQLELQQLSNKETFMEERAEPIPHFAVYRKGMTGKITLLEVAYKADDPDDREYKRIFAEERVDALNEKP